MTSTPPLKFETRYLIFCNDDSFASDQKNYLCKESHTNYSPSEYLQNALLKIKGYLIFLLTGLYASDIYFYADIKTIKPLGLELRSTGPFQTFRFVL